MQLTRGLLRLLLCTYFALFAFNLYKNSAIRSLEFAEHFQSFQRSLKALVGIDSPASVGSSFLTNHSHLFIRMFAGLLFVLAVASLVFGQTFPALAGFLFLAHQAVDHNFLDAYFESAVRCEPLFRAVSLFVASCLLSQSQSVASPQATPGLFQARGKKEN